MIDLIDWLLAKSSIRQHTPKRRKKKEKKHIKCPNIFSSIYIDRKNLCILLF